jgi:hypothetical protein
MNALANAGFTAPFATLLIVAGMLLLLIALGSEPRLLDPTVPGADLFARARSKVHS